MEKIVINTTVIRNAVQMVSQYTPKANEANGEELVLEGVDGKLSVKAFNYEQKIIVSNIEFKSTINGFDAFSIDAKKFLKALSACKSDEVALMEKDKKLFISCGRNKYKVDIFDSCQDIFPKTTQNSFVLDSKTFKDMKGVLHAIDSTNVANEKIMGMNLQVSNDKLTFVGTDTRRLSIFKSDAKSNLETSLHVPKIAVEGILKLFGADDSIKFSYDENTVMIDSGNLYFESLLFNSTFVDFNKIIPSKYNDRFTINKAFLTELAKEASVFNENVALCIKENKIILTDTEGDSKVTEDFNYDKGVVFVAFNAKYLIDALNSISDKEIELGINAPSLPFSIISSSGLEIIMPLSLEEQAVEDMKKAA